MSVDKAIELLEIITDGVWDWDLINPDREYMSPKFWRTFGYDPEKMPHSPKAWQTIIHPDDASVAEAAFHDHLKYGKPYYMPVRYTHKKGHTVWVICRGVAIRDENGTPIRMIGCHQDITELMKTQGAMSKLDEIMARADRTLGRLTTVTDDP